MVDLMEMVVAPMEVMALIAVTIVVVTTPVLALVVVAEDDERATLVVDQVCLMIVLIPLLLLDRYRDQDSRRASETSGYGGGSYDSGRKGRYTDEPRDTHSNDDNYTATKTTSSSTKKTSSSGGGKFKVNIKSEASKSSVPVSSHQSQPEVDFFGSSGPAEVFSAPAASFDAFGMMHSYSDLSS
jgi:hypothetical protein